MGLDELCFNGFSDPHSVQEYQTDRKIYDVISCQNNPEREASPKFIKSLASKLGVHPGFMQLLGPIHSLRKIIRGNIFLNSHHLHIMGES